MFDIPLLMGTPSGASEGTSQGSMIQIGMIVAVFAVFWFLIIRPQRKKQKETKEMIAMVKKGNRITSIGGIRGTVKNVTDSTVIVEVDNKGTTLEFAKTAIGSVNNQNSDPVASDTKSKAVKEEAGKSPNDE